MTLTALRARCSRGVARPRDRTEEEEMEDDLEGCGPPELDPADEAPCTVLFAFRVYHGGAAPGSVHVTPLFWTIAYPYRAPLCGKCVALHPSLHPCGCAPEITIEGVDAELTEIGGRDPLRHRRSHASPL